MKRVAGILIVTILLSVFTVMANETVSTFFEGTSELRTAKAPTFVGNYDSEVTAVYILVSNEMIPVELQSECLNIHCCAARNALWKEICKTAMSRGCVIKDGDKVIVFYRDFGVEKVAIVQASERAFANDEFGMTIEA
mgnify:CR=1 FL=1|jgi:hypothetical protein